MWHSNWGNVKAPNAKACALYHEIANVGKTIESSKKRVIWRLKVEEGREFEISLTHSLASGKKVLRVDGIVKYTAQALSFGDWDYVFNLPGGHVVHIIIKPSMELNDMYDLIVDGVSFRRLPDRLEGGNGSTRNKSQSAPPPRAKPTYYYSGSGRDDDGYDDESNRYERTDSREREMATGSFTPWECPVCTLVNDKPLAPVCEACGNAKPLNPKFVSRVPVTRAQSAREEGDRRSHDNRGRYQDANDPAPASVKRHDPPVSDLLGTSEPMASPAMDLNSGFNPFETNGFGAGGAAADTGFANFDSSPAKAAQRAVQNEDISSMLSGLDFTAPPEPTPVPAPAVEVANPVAEGPSLVQEPLERRGSDKLWADSKLVDLNLKAGNGTDKAAVLKPTKHGQTLEQARMKESQKEKVPVLPVAPPMATNTVGFVPQINTLYGNGFNPHITVQSPTAYGGFNTYSPAQSSSFMMPQQQPSSFIPPPAQHQFMTNMTTNSMQPDKRNHMFSSDPFATLS